MNNVWKGLVVGGLTGVAAGIALDAMTRTSDKARDLGKQVAQHAPDAGRWVQSMAENTKEIWHDSDVPDKVRDTAHRVREADVPEKVRDAAHRVRESDLGRRVAGA
jgi:hypothetical protein